MQTTETEVPPPPPVTVPDGAATEIKLVATALDRVQNTALTLATEQALIRRKHPPRHWPTWAAATRTWSAGSSR